MSALFSKLSGTLKNILKIKCFEEFYTENLLSRNYSIAQIFGASFIDLKIFLPEYKMRTCKQEDQKKEFHVAEMLLQKFSYATTFMNKVMNKKCPKQTFRFFSP